MASPSVLLLVLLLLLLLLWLLLLLLLWLSAWLSAFRLELASRSASVSELGLRPD